MPASMKCSLGKGRKVDPKGARSPICLCQAQYEENRTRLTLRISLPPLSEPSGSR